MAISFSEDTMSRSPISIIHKNVCVCVYKQLPIHNTHLNSTQSITHWSIIKWTTRIWIWVIKFEKDNLERFKRKQNENEDEILGCVQCNRVAPDTTGPKS